MLMCLKYLAVEGAPPNINHRRTEEYCNAILEKLNDENGFKIFDAARQHIVALGDYERDTIRSRSYIDRLRSAVKQEISQ